MNNTPHLLVRCAEALYCEPWLLLPSMHRTLCAILEDHMTGVAHNAGGRASFFDGEDDDEDKKDSRTLVMGADGVAVLNVGGVIGRKVSAFVKSSGVADVLDVSNAAKEAMASASVKGVLLVMDSPGGTVTGVPEAAYALRQLAAVKPLVAYVDGLAASAGYWLAAQASAIYAEPSSQVGSIGVYQYILDRSRQAEQEGIKPMLFATGKYKGMGLDGMPITETQAQHIKDTVEIVFGWFKRDLAARSLSDEDMQGQTFFAEDAVSRNLIDRVGTRDDALAELRAMMKKGD
jgi:signal peptide peptidase SppA